MRTQEKSVNTAFIWIAALICVVIYAGTAFAENKTGQSDTGMKAQKNKLLEQKENYDAHRSYVKAHFNDDEMDSWFGWVLGNISGGGCEIGEALNVAGSIKDGDPKSWQDEWEKMAQRVEARAEKSLAGGHKISAGDAYRRACVCYRAALVSMMPDNPKFKTLAAKARTCLQKAGKLYDPPLEYVEIPFEKTVLPGYFIRANKNGKKCKTLVMIGGGEYANEETKRQQEECMDGLPNGNRKFVVTPLNEGASEHCINLNRSLMSQVVFDWLDEVFEKPGQPTTLKENRIMKITRIYTGKDGESHFADMEIPLSEAEGGLNISELQKTTGIQFLETHGNFDFHRAPHRQYVIFLDGAVEIETGNGVKKTFQAGDILLAEDTTGRGHIIRTLDEKEHRSIFVTID
jgi:hypothetical protein